MKQQKKRVAAILMSIVSLCAIFFNVPQLSMDAGAATTMTSIGLAEHGLKAYQDGWQYIYGNKGQVVNGKRTSDCSGLISAFFTDNGRNATGGVTDLVNRSVQSGPISTLPRIHGLIITISNNDHIGIYLGNNIAVDNSDYGVNMKYGPVLGSSRGWIRWHMLDNGIQYPTNGFYAYNGNMYYYQDRQYVVNTTVKNNGVTYTIGNDGIVKDSSGKAIPVNTSMYNEGFAAAKKIAVTDDGDSTALQGTVTTSAVNMRSAPNSSSAKISILYYGNILNITDTVEGESITDSGKTSTKWYYGKTNTGSEGYVCSLFVTLKDNSTTATPQVSAPTISYSANTVTMASADSDAKIYFTTDGSTPTTSSKAYTAAISHSGSVTYRAIAVKDGVSSKVATNTVMKNGSTFPDIYSDKWYFSYVEQAVLSGLVQGNSNGTFKPLDSITRAEFITVLANLADADLTQYTETSYTDCQSGWFKNAVAWCEKMGYVKGDGSGKFNPNAKITREEMCVILARFGNLTSNGTSTQFNDHSQISSWAKDAVYACKEAGIINGKTTTTFSPKENAQRCEAVKVFVVYREI